MVAVPQCCQLGEAFVPEGSGVVCVYMKRQAVAQVHPEVFYRSREFDQDSTGCNSWLRTGILGALDQAGLSRIIGKVKLCSPTEAEMVMR